VGRFRLFALLPLALCAVMLSGPGSSATQKVADTTLKATVGPSFSIDLQTADGTHVSQLDPGAYTIDVTDLSSLHDFHLSGPGVNMATDIETTGSVTWNVTFADGLYKYLCDAHPTQMRGTFRVGPAPPPLPKLSGRVGPKKTISLRNSLGAVVKTLPAATYKLTVKDSTKTDNFHLVGAGVNKRTGVAFRGSRTWTVSLGTGKKYTYRSDAHPKLGRTVRITAKLPEPPPPPPS
jgi:hypothetical protein